jgi:hypothetical protein
MNSAQPVPLHLAKLGGYYNASNHPNDNAFATLQTDGSIMAWGDSGSGGSGAPAGSGYTLPYVLIF